MNLKDQLIKNFHFSEEDWEITSEYKNRQKEKRIIEFQTMQAKKRYLQFIEKYPEVCRSANVGQIASYLGIDIATLSRIRAKL